MSGFLGVLAGPHTRFDLPFTKRAGWPQRFSIDLCWLIHILAMEQKSSHGKGGHSEPIGNLILRKKSRQRSRCTRYYITCSLKRNLTKSEPFARRISTRRKNAYVSGMTSQQSAQQDGLYIRTNFSIHHGQECWKALFFISYRIRCSLKTNDGGRRLIIPFTLPSSEQSFTEHWMPNRQFECGRNPILG